MPSRVDFIFNVTTQKEEQTGGRAGGWSEQWYTQSAISTTALADIMDRWCIKRAALLPRNNRIEAQRVNVVDEKGVPTGTSRTFEFEYPGKQNTDNAHPELALGWQMRGKTTPNHRNVFLPGTPAARIVNGEYAYAQAYHTKLVEFFEEVEANWQMKGRVRTNAKVKIHSIQNDGTLRTLAPHGLAVGDWCALNRCRTFAGIYAKGIYYVSAITSPQIAVLSGYVPPISGEIPIRGSIRKHEENLFNVDIHTDEIRYPDIVTREIGSPFKRFVGRR